MNGYGVTDWWRRQKREPEIERGQSFFLDGQRRIDPGAVDELSDSIEGRAQEIARAVRDRVRKRVEEKTWLAFEKTVVEGIPHDMVATDLGLPVSTVYRYKNRVRDMLAEEYHRVDPERRPPADLPGPTDSPPLDP
ncbi:MAG: hypothetical protein U0835_05120 [Isosphaeraceae bacterium]